MKKSTKMAIVTTTMLALAPITEAKIINRQRPDRDRLASALRTQLVKFESIARVVKIDGRKYYQVYPDPRNAKLKTTGVGVNISSGHNLTLLHAAYRHDPYVVLNKAKKAIPGTVNSKLMLSGIEFVSVETADRIMEVNINEAWEVCLRLNVDFDTQPDDAKLILWDMAYNMGETKMRGFKKLCAAVCKRNYLVATAEMTNSNWYRQTGKRGKELASRMSKINAVVLIAQRTDSKRKKDNT